MHDTAIYWDEESMVSSVRTSIGAESSKSLGQVGRE